jgi:TPR repeat protein
VTRSYPEAVKWYELAAQLGSHEATYNLARLHRLGRGVARNIERAETLYVQAAIAGLVDAQLSLAMLYEAGQGWPHNSKKAFYWYRQAALAGHADAQINLAYLYGQGLGVGKDLIESYAWYVIAAKAGHHLAADNVAVLASALNSQEIDTAKIRAAMLFSEAAGSQQGQSVERECADTKKFTGGCISLTVPRALRKEFCGAPRPIIFCS